jgi:beta-glucosidase
MIVTPFPENFIWGAASSAYQIEGAANADGKGSSVWDDFCSIPGAVANGQDGSVACDFYHRYPEDVRLMRELGLKAFRFSVSWPRILPEGRGRINEKGLKFYDKLVDLLLENGIAPYMTLYHWDLPSALQRKGGWLTRETCDAFAEYAEILARHFDGRVSDYITLNEPQVVLGPGHAWGTHAPGLKLTAPELLRCMHNMMLGHGLAADSLRRGSLQPVRVGIASTGRLCYPAEDTPENCRAACGASFTLTADDWIFSHAWCLDAAVLGRYPDNAPDFLREFASTVTTSDWGIIRQRLDFIGANIYHGAPADAQGNVVPFPAGSPTTAMGWPVTPEVLRFGPRWLYERYGLPIVITENGMARDDSIASDGRVRDPERIDFLRGYLSQLKKGLDDGTDIKGYFHWSFTDNFEWDLGYAKRFGLFYIDYPTQRRIKKDSAAWFREVVQTGGGCL